MESVQKAWQVLPYLPAEGEGLLSMMRCSGEGGGGGLAGQQTVGTRGPLGPLLLRAAPPRIRRVQTRRTLLDLCVQLGWTLEMNAVENLQRKPHPQDQDTHLHTYMHTYMQTNMHSTGMMINK